MRVIMMVVAAASVTFTVCGAEQVEIEETTSASSSDPGTPRTGETRTFGGIEMVWIPSGEFRMGSSLSVREILQRYGSVGAEPELWKDEHPQHAVRIDRGFWMGQYEVTNAQFRQFVVATGHQTEAEKEGWAWGEGMGKEWVEVGGLTWRNPGWPTEDKHPVASVSWDDVQAYVSWLSQRSGHRYRLPTEAEWEYACRAGTTSSFQWGNEADDGEGWLNAADQTDSPKGRGPNDRFGFNDGYHFPATVGTFRANAWGLHDMHGNVWEWCEDLYCSYPGALVSDAEDLNAGWGRVHRGGGWNSSPVNCRSSVRLWEEPDYRDAYLGFRVCRDADE